MDIYSQKGRWKIVMAILGFLIVGASIAYTNFLAKNIADEERQKVQLLGNVYKQLNTSSSDLEFYFEIIRNNKTVPVILVDNKGNVESYRNIDSIRAVRDKKYLPELLELFQSQHEPIRIDLTDANGKAFDYRLIYYGESALLHKLRMFPFVQAGIIIVFVLIGYILFSTSRRAEQNRVWVGMAKETAHQLGTPLTSLSGWVDYLKNTDIDGEVINELEKDVYRLELVAERFSKIGSEPELRNALLMPELQGIMDYLQRRSSGKVTFLLDGDDKAEANINPPLFNWAIENIMKNALDAMHGIGSLHVHVQQADGKTCIDITDSGKGIVKGDFQKVFQPGYSTKKRGWGLGLTLTKRIIQHYHKGKVFVKESDPGKGTTFRIELFS